MSRDVNTAEDKPREERWQYRVLKEAGHSAAKALEIVIDAERGDWYAVQWIDACRKLGKAA